MKTKSLFWGLLFGVFFLVLLIPTTREYFINFSGTYPYLGGFIKFFVLATFGEVLGLRIVLGKWGLPKGISYRAFIWGLLGMTITLALPIFSGGVAIAQKNNYLPDMGISIFSAFLTSLVMNATFGPVLMGLHRITDTYIDLKLEGAESVTIQSAIETINWSEYVSFVVLKTIPIFWVPAHTIVFSVPSEYRVLLAALLSVALGAILAFAKKKGSQQEILEEKHA